MGKRCVVVGCASSVLCDLFWALSDNVFLTNVFLVDIFQTFLSADEVTERIMNVVKNFDQVDPSKVSPETKFADDLGLDSLDVVEVVMAIEDEFAIEIPDNEADAITSIADAVEYISKHPMAK